MNHLVQPRNQSDRRLLRRRDKISGGSRAGSRDEDNHTQRRSVLEPRSRIASAEEAELCVEESGGASGQQLLLQGVLPYLRFRCHPVGGGDASGGGFRGEAESSQPST